MKKIKRGDADWHPQSSLPDSCWAQSHRVAAAHVNSCCCCDSIPCLGVSSSDPQLQNNTHPSSPVFASLTSVTTVDTNLNTQCKSEEKVYQVQVVRQHQVQHQVLSSTGKEVKLLSSSQKKKQLGQQSHQNCLRFQRLCWGEEV